MAGTSSLTIFQVCDATIGCEGTSGKTTTTGNFNGNVTVKTREYYSTGAFYGSFAGTAVTWTSTSPIFSGGVYVGTERTFQLTGVTSGSFSGSIQGTDGIWRNANLSIQ
ncbi:hypothetical protein JGU66_30270 [Myxococcaceae bacterium JPH2]|nr:hypothetical protein [Myxococcaceae bacterium JPH2]